MSKIAVIPARGGSKGVPMKNLRKINGIPLVGYAVKSALDSDCFDRVLVSTDNKEIADVANAYGAETPFLRPRDLSGDLASSDAVVAHALKFFQEEGVVFDEVCKLQPTSPLRTGRHIKEAFDLYYEKQADFVVSFCECEHSPLWSGRLGENASIDCFMSSIDKGACRQTLPKFFRLNGAIYLGKVDKFLDNGSFLGPNGYAYIMSQDDSVDIDSELDFELAELLLGKKRIRDGFQ